MVESLWHADRKNLGDRMQMIQFMKNVSMSGGVPHSSCFRRGTNQFGLLLKREEEIR